MADSSNVVLLPSTAEFCSMFASSMMVWSEGATGKKWKHEEKLTWAKYGGGSAALTGIDRYVDRNFGVETNHDFVSRN